jgi:hypothetical protein
VERAPTSWISKARAWPSRVWTASIAQVKKRFKQLKNRYGPGYTYAMVLAVLIALFSPVPGTTLVAIATIALIAEIHRAIAKSGGFSEAIATLWKHVGGTYSRKLMMSNHCDVIVKWDATPEQLRALGAALWRWCIRAAGNAGIYRCLDNQPLADLLAGKFPASSQTDHRGVHFRIRGEAALGRKATIDCLRRDLPADAVADILVDGTSWNQDDSDHSTVVPHSVHLTWQEIDDRRGETPPRPSLVLCESQ